jgi:hypothetical protein
MGREQKQRKRKRQLRRWKIRSKDLFNSLYRKIKGCKGLCYMCVDIECKKHPINNE